MIMIINIRQFFSLHHITHHWVSVHFLHGNYYEAASAENSPLGFMSMGTALGPASQRPCSGKQSFLYLAAKLGQGLECKSYEETLRELIV